ncbi:hypothetical protein LXL04_012182 [Taraxacum kok-saghyz]
MIQLEIVKEAIAGNSGRQEILDWGEVMEQIERRIIEGGKEINAGVEKTDFSNYPPQVSEIAAMDSALQARHGSIGLASVRRDSAPPVLVRVLRGDTPSGNLLTIREVSQVPAFQVSGTAGINVKGSGILGRIT